MNREVFEKNYLNENVKVTLKDGDVLSGKLKKTGLEEFEDDLNLYIPRNYYFIEFVKGSHSCLFRKSHIRKIEEIEV